MLLGDVPSPVVLYNDEHGGNGQIASTDEATQARPERGEDEGEQVSYIDRKSLLERPPLQPVPGEEGHYVSPHSSIRHLFDD